MNKILSIICLASFLVSGFSAMPVMAEETPEICSETSSQERASWSLSNIFFYILKRWYL